MLPQHFIKPRYGSHCFSDLPSTIKYLLTGSGTPLLADDILAPFASRYETVILFFIDAFGWRFFAKYADDYPFLQHMVRHGSVQKITSQFPPTTTAHTTAIHTGLPVGQSGMYGWNIYEPKLDEVITPLLFSHAGADTRDTLATTGIDPAAIYPSTNIYQDLARHGITSHIIQHIEYTPSTYSNIVFAGVDRLIPYKTLPEALTNLQLLLARQRSPSYYFLYFDKIDTICHAYGPNSPQVEAEIDALLTQLDRLFMQTLHGQLQDALFMLVADHGQAETDPETTVYLNLDPRLTELLPYLKTNRRGKPLVPVGSPRDMYLHVDEEKLEDAHQILGAGLGDIADIVRVADLIEQGFYGPQPLSTEFLARVGNLVILPYRYESVWWFEEGRFAQTLYGHHGGLTREEMEVPLILYDFGAA